jgi:hypothetical protein
MTQESAGTNILIYPFTGKRHALRTMPISSYHINNMCEPCPQFVLACPPWTTSSTDRIDTRSTLPLGFSTPHGNDAYGRSAKANSEIGRFRRPFLTGARYPTLGG